MSNATCERIVLARIRFRAECESELPSDRLIGLALRNSTAAEALAEATESEVSMDFAEPDKRRPVDAIKALRDQLSNMDTIPTKRRLDRTRLIGTIGMVACLEWVLGVGNGQELVALARAELAEAVKHANR